MENELSYPVGTERVKSTGEMFKRVYTEMELLHKNRITSVFAILQSNNTISLCEKKADHIIAFG